MEYKDLKEKVKKDVEERGFSHNWGHIKRVVNNAEYLATEEGADIEILRYAALLHDYVREPEHEYEPGAAIESSKKANKLLKDTEMEETKINRILKAVEKHSRLSEEGPESIEEKVVYDADKLDAVGVIGIIRQFSMGEKLGWSLEKTAKKYLEEGEKLIKEEKAGYTKTGRKIILERYQESKRICENLLEELKN